MKAITEFQFSERELEVLRLVAKGHGNKEIAKAVFLSPLTVNQYVFKLREKVDCENRQELIQFARTFLGEDTNPPIEKKDRLEQANRLLKQAVAILTEISMEETHA